MQLTVQLCAEWPCLQCHAYAKCRNGGGCYNSSLQKIRGSGGCDYETLEARISRREEPELLAFQSGGGDGEGHAHPSAGQKCAPGPSGSTRQLGEGFMEEVAFAQALKAS